MQKTNGFVLNLVFFLQVLILFLLFVEDSLVLPAWLQVAGRLHPAMLHLPIGLMAFGVILALSESQFKKKAFTKITMLVLTMTALTASLTALFGFFLSQQGDYGPEALTQHRNSGIVLSFLCYFLLLAYSGFGKVKGILYYGLGLFTVAGFFYAGHTGSVLTHGENFVLAPVTKSADPALGPDATAFQVAVYPILERKCTSCHNEAKAKGKFIMTSLADFKKGGRNGVEWEAGKPLESRMIKFIHLPLGDDDHMPPDGKPQLSEKEIKVLEYWIASGADTEKKLADLPATDSLKMMGEAALAAAKMVKTEEKVYSFSAAPEETIAKLNTPFRSVFPLYQNSPALQADFFIRESFKPESLSELKEVQNNLVVLNLSKMPVTDAELAVIATFTNLEKLNLNFSGVTGAGMATLAPLKNLSSLSLAGTSVNVENVRTLLDNPSLRELFVWNTRITEEDRKGLSAQYPKITIVTTSFADRSILRLGKPQMILEGVVKSGQPIALKHSMPGVQIRYTVDGNAPDSVQAKVYEKPLEFATTTRIKAIACKSGWYCSPVFEVICFVGGQKPAKTELLSAPDKQYPGEGASTLTDGRKGFADNFKDPTWLGFQNDQFAAAFTFAADAPAISSMVISYGRNIGSSIFPPEAVELWAGKSKADARLIRTIKMEQPATYEPQTIEAMTIPIVGPNYRYYKLIARPVKKLPEWHSSKGKKGWVFVDEVFFY